MHNTWFYWPLSAESEEKMLKISYPITCMFTLLQVFDKDNDGFITADELKEAMQTLGDRLTDKEVSNSEIINMMERKTVRFSFLKSISGN